MASDLKKADAINLLTELCFKKKLLKPASVSIEQRKLDSYQLKIKGDCDSGLKTIFSEYKNLTVEEDKEKGLLIIS